MMHFKVDPTVTDKILILYLAITSFGLSIILMQEYSGWSRGVLR
jgi:hypothetical protein